MDDTTEEDLVRLLGSECPACGDTYHDLPGHLTLNFKGCADADHPHGAE